MTVKELKRMLEDIDDDAILLTRSALEPSEFEQPSARTYCCNRAWSCYAAALGVCL